MTAELILLSNRSGDVTIANAGTESTIFRAAGYGAFIAAIPAAFTGTSISFRVADEELGTFQPLRDKNNAVVSRAVTQGNSYQLPPELTGARFFKVVSNAAESAARTIKVLAIAGNGGGGSGVVTVGTGATDLGKAEDTPHASGDTGVLMLGVRNANSAVLTDAEGDYSAITVDSAGRIQIGRLVPGTGVVDLGKAEDTGHTSGDTGVEMLAVRRDVAASSTPTDGDYATVNTDALGRQWTNASLSLDNAGVPLLASAVTIGTADGLSGIYFGPAVEAWNRLYNGATFDNERANTNGTVLASAARTATPTKVDQTNHNARTLILVIDVTAVTATPSVVFTIQGKDPLSGKYYTILASVAITAVGTTVLRVDPALTAAANTIANDILPRTWAVDAVHGDADSISYSVGSLLIR